MDNNTRLEEAILFAADAHTGQVRDNGEPFILHPIRVMCAVDTIEAKIVAVLHDVIEDTYVTYESLLLTLGIDQNSNIAYALALITRKPRVSYNVYISDILNSDLSTTVKLADLKDNLDMLTYNCSDEKKLARCIKHTKAYHILNGSL
jgi:(p)ppGpp synthase/HD superfamily hydrolase